MLNLIAFNLPIGDDVRAGEHMRLDDRLEHLCISAATRTLSQEGVRCATAYSPKHPHHPRVMN